MDVEFFRTLDVPILAGRGFQCIGYSCRGLRAGENDRRWRRCGQRVVRPAKFSAETLSAGDSLCGRSTAAAAENEEVGNWHEIVGIVRDFPAGVSPGMHDSQLRLYHALKPGEIQPVHITVRVRDGAPSTFGRRISEVAAAVDPTSSCAR